MNNEQFEIEYRNGFRCYITVLDSFKHHYTGETMRTIRVERLRNNGDLTTAYTRLLNEEEFNDYLKQKVKGPIGYVIFEGGNKEEITKLVRVQSEIFSLEFETKVGWYRFNMNLRPYVALRHWEVIEELKQYPTFEWKNDHNNKWEPAFIDHIEIYDEYWK